MGYETEFAGEFKVEPRLKAEHNTYLHRFTAIRHVKLEVGRLDGIGDPVREAVGLPIGPEGAFFTGHLSKLQGVILDFNTPPEGVPGLWCDWDLSDDGDSIEWSGETKFYDYSDWMVYLINTFLQPWGYKVNGEVKWQGENMDDRGKIVVVDNVVNVERLE